MGSRLVEIAGFMEMAGRAPDECKVCEIKTLGLENDGEAKRLLRAVAAQVQPIMRRRRWRVGVLSEFRPRNPSLLGLNVNGGREIKIRLRRHGRDSEFYEYDFVLGTMLHELTHIGRGPHDAKFYKLLDEVTKECEDLMAKGITGTGQGFDASGKKLSNASHNPPASSLRKTALAAAEKRQRLGSLLPAGPQKLGGDISMRNSLSPAQAAAMAAERRFRDDLWCGAPETIGEDGDGKAKDRENRGNTLEAGPSEACRYKEAPPPSKRAKVPEWECNVCTLLNPPLAPICAACGSTQPEANLSKNKAWACKFCASQNPVAIDRCVLCDEWRYSTGH
ncbi:DNA-dependent metalloprotease WSS1 [Selaginella moellendorffii]|nr:DNA-dependent metalloprotease WSS1 [Selaginella moellendorffii]|eukprot:XP_002962564.2 DNA-dependent metalloprotease WSS1 [Selaginella moellendorffii]